MKIEHVPGTDMPFVLRWRRVFIALGLFAAITIVYAICWALGLATEQPKF